MILALDAKLFFFLNKACANPVFDFLMPLITRLGDGDFVLVLAIIMVLAAFVTRRIRKMPGILLLAGLAISHFVVYYFKQFFSRPRPFVALENVRVLMAGLDKNHSFPSGHATLAFIAAVILASYFKRGYLFFLAAIVICFSRVYVGAHYVSDVIAGTILGAAIGYALVYVAKRLQKK